MASHSEYGHQGWDFNFQGQDYLDPIDDYTDLFPFARLEFDDLDAGDSWTENQSPLLHGPISSGMDILFGNGLWVGQEALAFHGPNICETDISDNIDMALSYQMGHKSESHTNSSSSGLTTPSNLAESSISPTQVSCKPVPPLPKRPKKRTLEDCQSEFMGPNPVSGERRRRRPYEQKRRIEVGMTRQVGACIRCKIMKTPCGSGTPCDRCMKLYGNPYLSQALCERQQLLHVRLGSLKLDLWDRKHDSRWLKRNLTPFQGSRRIIELSLVNFCDISAFVNDLEYTWDGGHDGPWTPVPPLQIEVQDFRPGPGREVKHNLNVTLMDNKKTILTPPSYYAIPGDALPTLEKLSQWALDSTRFQRRSIFDEGLQGSFMSLARRYYECKIVLPLRSLMQQAVRLSCLHGMWCSALPEPKKTRYETPRYASKAVHKQIAGIITPGIEALERDILGQLQFLIFSQKGRRSENELPIWICLWLLMLTYRRTILHWSTRRNRDSYLELSQHMYNMLISTYSTQFRNSTPLWHDFLKDDIFELFGRDFSILERMGTIKTEMGYIHNGDEDFQTSYDKLLHPLIFEHEKKLGQEALQKAIRLRSLHSVT